MSGFNAIDLSKLAPPDVVEALSYEAIFVAMRDDFVARCAAVGIDFDITLETEPAMILLQAAAWREFMLRQRVNEAAKSVMVAYALGTDLDQLGALFGVKRLEIAPADEEAGTAAVMESDDAFRARIVLAPESYSVAGPPGAYIFHALSADPEVMSVSVDSPDPGEVVVTILSRTGTGAASSELVSNVTSYLASDNRRPLTDHVTVQSATIVNYAVTATIKTYAGPDASIVMAAAQASIQSYVAASVQLGRDITRSGIFAALHVAGVQNVALASPAADIVLNSTQAGHCTAIALTHGGIAD